MPPATPPAAPLTDTSGAGATGGAPPAGSSLPAGHVEHPPVSAAARAAAPPHPPRPAGAPPVRSVPTAAAPTFSRPAGAVTSVPAAPAAGEHYLAGPAVAAVSDRGAIVTGAPYAAAPQAPAHAAGQTNYAGSRPAPAHAAVVPFARPVPPAAPQAARPVPSDEAHAGPATIPAGHRFAAPAAAPARPGGEPTRIAGSIGPARDVPAPDLSPADAAANRVLDTLMKLGHRVRGVLDARFSPMKMTDARYMALRVVQDSAPEGCTQAKLAAALGQCESSVSTLVERMRTGKLVYRLHPKSDRRKRVLLLTDLGREALEHAEAARAEAAKELCDALTHEERDHLCEALGRLLAGVQQTDAEAGRRRKVA